MTSVQNNDECTLYTHRISDLKKHLVHLPALRLALEDLLTEPTRERYQELVADVSSITDAYEQFCQEFEWSAIKLVKQYFAQYVDPENAENLARYLRLNSSSHLTLHSNLNMWVYSGPDLPLLLTTIDGLLANVPNHITELKYLISANTIRLQNHTTDFHAPQLKNLNVFEVTNNSLGAMSLPLIEKIDEIKIAFCKSFSADSLTESSYINIFAEDHIRLPKIKKLLTEQLRESHLSAEKVETPVLIECAELSVNAGYFYAPQLEIVHGTLDLKACEQSDVSALKKVDKLKAPETGSHRFYELEEVDELFFSDAMNSKDGFKNAFPKLKRINTPKSFKPYGKLKMNQDLKEYLYDLKAKGDLEFPGDLI
ncbi:MAG TPA: hypothetical protein VD999_03335 [Vitreimonas sp.]|nr:hypothetical protein [Vitreimonas sp.]